jgi:hypothetical protein
MEKLKDNIKSGYFLEVSEWWGLSDKPGSKGIFVYPDGSYTLKTIYYRSTEEPIAKKEGKLSLEALDLVKQFIQKNIKENSKQMIFDAGCSIEVTLDDHTIKVENNISLFSEITKLLPFKD